MTSSRKKFEKTSKFTKARIQTRTHKGEFIEPTSKVNALGTENVDVYFTYSSFITHSDYLLCYQVLKLCDVSNLFSDINVSMKLIYN